MGVVKIIFLIFIVLSIVPAFNAIGNFLGLDQNEYQPYVIWAVVLLTFWFTLPKNRSDDLLK